MDNVDLEYLCTTMANLAGMPVRIFENGKQTFYTSTIDLPVDPLTADRDSVLAVHDHVGYYLTDRFSYYGVVNSGAKQVVFGPSRQIPAADRQLIELAFRCDVAPDDREDFIRGMKAIIPMPVESLIQMLCTLNYVLNGEKKTLKDIAITDALQTAHDSAAVQRHAAEVFAESNTPSPDLHNTYDLEQALMHMIRKGDVAGLTAWMAQAPAVRGGVLAPDQLRQRKNLFIVTATLASRAAVRGGLDVDDAFSLSDAYIQKCELMNGARELTNLQYHMVLDFTERVDRLHQGSNPTPLVLEVANYIQHHLSEPITTEAMAKELHMSRTYLSRRFHAEAGETLTDRVLKEKTEEAKRLLRYTDKPLSAISIYLGFSSQSHFSRVFSKYAGLSPSDYRMKHSEGKI